MIKGGVSGSFFMRNTRTVPRSENSLGSGEEYIRIFHLTEEGAVDEFVPICCFCSMVRDDRDTEAGKGPWINLSTYARSRQLPLSHRFVFSHGYCPDCVAHFEERLAAYRPTTAWDSLRAAARRLIEEADGGRRKHAKAVSDVEDVPSDREEANGAVY